MLNRIKHLLCFLFFTTAVATTAQANKEIHQHNSKDIGADTPVPKIEILLFKDVMDGVNVRINVENYVINAPDAVEDPYELTPSGFLQGHAHVFVNGNKLVRLYGTDVHVPNSALQTGVNEIAITLNSHHHENWVSDSDNIVGSVFFDMSKTPIMLQNYTSQPLENKQEDHSNH